MASLSQVIDTGRSLDNDIKFQGSSTVQEQPADIMPATSHMTQVLGETVQAERETYFTFQEGVIEVYKSSAGQTYLTVQPSLVFLVLGVLVLAVTLKIVVLFAKRKKHLKRRAAIEEVVTSDHSMESVLAPELLKEDAATPTSRPKIRRLTL